MIKESDSYISSQTDTVTTSDSNQVLFNLVITQETGGTNSNAQ